MSNDEVQSANDKTMQHGIGRGGFTPPRCLLVVVAVPSPPASGAEDSAQHSFARLGARGHPDGRDPHPYSFRAKRQQWTYAGPSLVTCSSADYELPNGELRRSRKRVPVLGLNANHNHLLKAVLKDATATSVARGGALRSFYKRRVEHGMRPERAHLTLARKIATLALTLWKKGERFNAEHLKPQAA